MKLQVKATPEQEGRRLDLFLAFNYPDYSRSYFKKLITTEKVLINGEVEFHPQYKLKKDDNVEIDLEPLQDVQKIRPVELDLNIVSETSDYLVINKPSGMVVHPGSGHWDDTLANGIKAYLGDDDLFGDERAGLVHRLDSPTSGIIIVAKTPQALWHLSKQFAQRLAHKTYLCVVKGDIGDDFTVLNDIGRDRHNRQKFSSHTTSGKRAETTFKRLAVSEDGKYSLVAAYPKTGRTHQIRVHLSEHGHPIMGDQKYGGGKQHRLLLHAYELEIMPEPDSSDAAKFRAPLPKDFQEATLALGFSPAILKEYAS